MYIVLDTNIWRAELGLNSGLGAATRLFLRQQSATLAVPEVIRLETEKHIRAALHSYISEIDKNHSKLLSIFGKLKEVSLPTDKEVEEIIDNIFSELEVPIEDIPFTLESARNSYLNIVENQPPSDRNQQFKDGVIWADCMNLLDKDDVHFVTSDKAFYKGHDYNQGLASNLQEETKGKPHKFEIHYELTSLIESIRTEIEITADELFHKFMKEYQDKVQNILDKHSYEIEEISSNKIKAYATKSPATIYVDFDLKITCSPLMDDGRSKGVLTIKGDATFNPETTEFLEMRRSGEEFKFKLADGTEEYSKSAVLRAGPLVIGHRDVEHTIKFEL